MGVSEMAYITELNYEKGLSQGVEVPNGVVPIKDETLISYYQSQGYLVVPVEEVERMAEGEGLNGFWQTLLTPFKKIGSGIKWLAVQPVHGFKWVWNKASGIWEQKKTEEVEQPSGGGGTVIKKAGLLTNPIFLIGVGLAAYVAWKMYKHEPLPIVGETK